jgi:murein DD-endopeptidase MepM/ murein hydrolase activator NlpD
MNLQLIASRAGRSHEFDLSEPRNLLVVLAFAALAVAGVFVAGLQIGRYVAGPLQGAAIERAMDSQRLEINTARQQLAGQVDALALRVGTLNAEMLRLDALGRRVTDLAGLDRGEFNFDEPPPAGGPDDTDATVSAGSAEVPELTAVLDALETQLENRQRQFVVLESLMSMRELGERILPGGLPLIGGWISSHFGKRADPFTGAIAFHKGVDFVGRPGSRVLAVGPGLVTYSGYKSGYGYVVEITHPTGQLTRYGHNSRNLVRVGQTVTPGQAIAVIGSTGRSTGTHVHFEVEQDGKLVNPMKFLSKLTG